MIFPAQTSGMSAASPPNGPGAAAVLAAGVGCFTLGVVAVLADKLPRFARLLNLYPPTGPLSGVSTSAIIVWLAVWAVLHLLWRKRNVELHTTTRIALMLLACGALLTFPPVGDLF